MAMSSLLSMVRMAMRAAGSFPSSPGIYGSRNALFNVDGRSILDVALSGFAGSRGTRSRAQPRRRRPSVPGAVTRRRRVSLPRPQGSLGSAAGRGRGARRLHVSGDEHADDAFAAMTVAASSAFAGVWYWMTKSDKQPALILDEDPAMVEEEEDTEEDDSAMRARFADWMEKCGRTYQDEEEKARRFEIFKAFARVVDAANAEAAESGSFVRYGLTEFADWNARELATLWCCEISSDDEYQELDWESSTGGAMLRPSWPPVPACRLA